MGDKKTQTLLEAMQGLVIYAHCWKCTKQFRLTPFYVIRRGWQDKDSLTFRPKHAQCGTRLSFVCIPKDKAYGYGNERRLDPAAGRYLQSDQRASARSARR